MLVILGLFIIDYILLTTSCLCLNKRVINIRFIYYRLCLQRSVRYVPFVDARSLQNIFLHIKEVYRTDLKL